MRRSKLWHLADRLTAWLVDRFGYCSWNIERPAWLFQLNRRCR